MAEPFLSEIRIMSFVFAPKGWALCNGQRLPINQNQALFALLGTAYGGNGSTNFALPNLQGAVPIHTPAGMSLGEKGGTTQVTLAPNEMPLHTHVLNASSKVGDTPVPTGHLLANTPAKIYSQNFNSTIGLNAINVTSVGGSQAHT